MNSADPSQAGRCVCARSGQVPVSESAPVISGARRLAVLPIRFYQWFISPILPPSCRFSPSCSAYAVEAVLVHGVVYGGWLALRRLLRCHPWSAGGYDPVPPFSGKM